MLLLGKYGTGGASSLISIVVSRPKIVVQSRTKTFAVHPADCHSCYTPPLNPHGTNTVCRWPKGHGVR